MFAGGYVLLSFAVGHTIGPSIRDLHILSGREALRQVAPWLVPIGFVLSVLGFRGLGALRRHSRRSATRVIAFILTPVGMALVLAAVAGVTFKVRHVIWAAAPLMVLVGAGAAGLRRSRLALAASVGLCVLWGIAIYNRNARPRYENEDLAGVGRYLEAHGAAGEPVYVTPPYMIGVARLYLGPARSVLPLPGAMVREGADTASVDILERHPSPGPFWVVYTRPFHADPSGRLLAGMEALPGFTRAAEFAGTVLLRGQSQSDSVLFSRASGIR